MNYRVLVFEVEAPRQRTSPTERPSTLPEKVPEQLEGFGVEADSEDQAKAEAKAWLADRGFTVRSMAWSSVEGQNLSIVAYVFKTS